MNNIPDIFSKVPYFNVIGNIALIGNNNKDGKNY